MLAGRLDRSVLIESLTEAGDTTGDVVETWTPVATVWASKRDIGGKEYLSAAQEHADVTAVFRMRYRADVDATCLLTCEGNVFDIVNTKELGRREGLELMAKRADDG